jgi:outer membrane protein OmpA-like peptidoglycan-associated protein
MFDMRISRMVLAASLLATLSMTGCKNSVKEENLALKDELGSLRNQLTERNKALEDCSSDLRSRDQQLAELRREVQASPTGVASNGSTPFDDIAGVTASQSAGEITASVESDLLFDSGKTSLKSAAKQSLDQVAGVLKSSFSTESIRVVGHTDSDPIKKSGFKTNYHLGFERAFAVRDYLVSKGVDSKRISLASFGPDLPHGTKSQSRRVEIVVVRNG